MGKKFWEQPLQIVTTEVSFLRRCWCWTGLDSVSTWIMVNLTCFCAACWLPGKPVLPEKAKADLSEIIKNMLACSWCELLIGAASFIQGNLNNTGHGHITRETMENPSWWIIFAQALCLEQPGTKTYSGYFLSFHIKKWPVEALVTATCRLNRSPSGFSGFCLRFQISWRLKEPLLHSLP